MPNIIRGHVKYPPRPITAPATPIRKVKEGCAINYWTPREDEVIKACYVSIGPEGLGERFGRTASSVNTRANELGLKRQGI